MATKRNSKRNRNNIDYFFEGYNYVKKALQEEQEELNRQKEIAKYNFAINIITLFAVIAIILVLVVAIIMEAAKDDKQVETEKPIVIVINKDNEVKTPPPTVSEEKIAETEPTYPLPENSEADKVVLPKKQYETYSSISEFSDAEIIELQKLAVAEGGFKEPSMQACAFSVIQTAREEDMSIKKVINSGKYSCVKGGVITLCGREVTKKEYSQAAEAVRRAITEGPGPIGEALYEEVVRLGLDVEEYYGNGPIFFYKEKLLSQKRKREREAIKAKILDPDSGMYFYYRWDT